MISLTRLLSQAEDRCLQHNVRLTPQRREVLRLIACQRGAISAYDLLDLLKASEPRAKPPTVYRALDFLLAQGLIHKVESTNSYVMCRHLETPSHTSALFICHHCGQVTESATQEIDKHLATLATNCGFVLQHTVVELHGLCQQCEENRENPCTGSRPL